jgi:hypothetical protein
MKRIQSGKRLKLQTIVALSGPKIAAKALKLRLRGVM